MVNAGTGLIVLKRQEKWKSSNVAERYIEESFTNKANVEDKIFRGGRVKEKSANNSNNMSKKKYQLTECR